MKQSIIDFLARLIKMIEWTDVVAVLWRGLAETSPRTRVFVHDVIAA